MPYNEGNSVDVPSLDLLTFLFESEHCAAVEDTPLHAEASEPDAVITKAAARDLTRQFAYFLRQQYGIGADGPGEDVVLAVSTGQSVLPCFFFGVVAAGGVYSAANPASTVEALAAQIKDGPSKVVACSADLKDLAVKAAECSGLPPSSVLVLESRPEPKLQSVDATIECDFAGQLPWQVVEDPEELADTSICILYSSGTTGAPKGVLISHANMVAEAFLPAYINRPLWAKRAVAEGKPVESRTLAHLPTAHVSGVQGYFVNPFYDGGIVYWMSKFDFAQFLAHNAALRVTTFFTVPPIYLGIAKHPLVKDHFASLRTAYSGACPLRQDVQLGASAKFAGGATLISQTWGSSETTGAVTHMPPDRRDTTGSVSPLLPNMIMRLVDEDDNDVAPGQPGEALLKGPVITKGYHNNPEANKAAFTEDGWFRMGDIAQVKDDLLYVLDRKTDLFKYDGNQVSPIELERLLTSHPAVADAVVIGVQDGDVVVPRAYVVLAPGKDIAVEDLASHVNGQVEVHKQLRGGVVLVGAIPKTPSGKVLRREVRGLVAKAEPVAQAA